MRKLFLSSTKPRPRTFTSSSQNALENISISNEVLAVVGSSEPIEPSLDRLAPFLNREIACSVLQDMKKEPELCFRFFNWAAGKPHCRSGHSTNLVRDMILSGDNLGSFDTYWSLLDELRTEDVKIHADAFAALILAYWRIGKAEKAVEAFGRMREYGCTPDVAAYNVILNVLVKKGVILVALAVYNVFLKSNSPVVCDTYNVLIDGLCKSGMIQDALNLFDEMSDRGITPNTISYTVIISGLCKEKRVEDAHRLFDSMKSIGCKPDSTTYTVLLDGLCRSGKVDEALGLFNSFRGEGYRVNIQCFSSLVDGMIRAKRVSEAENLFQKGLNAGLVPDVVLYTIMMRGLCEVRRMEEAVNMLRVMIRKGVMPDTQCYNVVIKGFCDVGLLDQAKDLKLEISQHELFPNTCTYTLLICGLCRNGLSGEAQQIFDDMEKQGCSPSVATFNALIDGLCKAGKLEEAHLVLYRMEIGKNPSLFLRLSQGEDRVLDSTGLRMKVGTMVESGLILEAYNLLVKISDSGVVPDINTYNILINGMCKAGLVNGALTLFKELQRRGHSPDSVTYATLINGLERSDREGDALKLLEQMKRNGCRRSQSVYKTLMTWYCRRKKLSDAFFIWLDYLRDISGREGEALNSIKECFERGEMVMAVRNLLELDIKWIGFDSAPYSIWLVGQCQVKKADEALKIFSVLEEFRVVVSAPACAMLIGSLCSEGNLKEAVDVFRYTMQKGHRLEPRICNKLLKALLRLDGKSQALGFELVDEMEAMGYDLHSNLYKRTKDLLRHWSIKMMENE